MLNLKKTTKVRSKKDHIKIKDWLKDNIKRKDILILIVIGVLLIGSISIGIYGNSINTDTYILQGEIEIIVPSKAKISFRGADSHFEIYDNNKHIADGSIISVNEYNRYLDALQGLSISYSNSRKIYKFAEDDYRLLFNSQGYAFYIHGTTLEDMEKIAQTMYVSKKAE